jgi:hypothetical protein
MAIIGKNQELPRERWKLYDHAASVLVQHWDVNKHLGTELLAEDDKRDLLRALAMRMQAAKGGLAGNYIHRDDLLDEFEKYLRKRFGHEPGHAAKVAREMIDQFRERNYILASLGASLYGFVHRAFLEYFCADAIVTRFEKTKLMTMEQLKEEVFGAHVKDRAWHEVLRLICGKIGEQFAGEVILFLLARGEYQLAIECVSEVRNAAAIADVVEQVTESVLNEILVNSHFLLSTLDLRPLLALPQSIPVVLRWLAQPPAGDAEYPYVAGRVFGLGIRGNEEIYPLVENLALRGTALRMFALIALIYGYGDRPIARRAIATIALNSTREEHIRYVAIRYGDFTADELNRLAGDPSEEIRERAKEVLDEAKDEEPS